jgi:hypothetical protein
VHRARIGEAVEIARGHDLRLDAGGGGQGAEAAGGVSGGQQPENAPFGVLQRRLHGVHAVEDLAVAAAAERGGRRPAWLVDLSVMLGSSWTSFPFRCSLGKARRNAYLCIP